MSDGLQDYSSFKAFVADWVARSGDTDLLARVPDFIFLAENRLAREMDWPFQEKTATGTFTAGQDYIDAPADLAWPRDLTVLADAAYSLDVVAIYKLEAIRFRANGRNPSAMALQGTATGPRFLLAPVPQSSTLGYRLTYFSGVDHLSDSNQTNWMLLHAPDVLMAATQLVMAPYIGEDDRMPIYSSILSDALPSLKRAFKRQRTGGGPLRVRPDVVA